jgi:ribonuclease BN (tRNA processing enzyme)
MDLTVIGAGPAFTDRAGATGAAYLVRSGSTSLLLDLGQGSFPRLAGELDPSTLDAVVISHLHPDHFIDLVPLRHYLRYRFDPPRCVAVHGPAELLARIDALHGEPGFAAQVLTFHALTEGAVPIGDLVLESRLVTHTDESYGFRVSPASGGPGLVYSGDCGRADDLGPLLRPGDALLAEASFGPEPAPPGSMHLDGPAVGALAASRGAGAVYVTHIGMGVDETATVASVAEQFGGPVTLAQPGTRATI